jgi:hypothetical protein
MCWGFFQAALECALKERAGSVGLAGFVSGYSLDIFRNYEKIDKITAPVRTAQRLGKERCQKDCADHDRSGIWSEPIVKLPRVLVREQFHAWEKFFPACLRGVVFFFYVLHRHRPLSLPNTFTESTFRIFTDSSHQLHQLISLQAPLVILALDLYIIRQLDCVGLIGAAFVMPVKAFLSVRPSVAHIIYGPLRVLYQLIYLDLNQSKPVS